MLTHLSLFSGIGGFDIAAEWAGFRTVCFVEIDPFCQKVLRKHWPDVPIVGDINEFDGREYRGTVDLITGGVPCQPVSIAGQRRGEADDRWLWPEAIRVLSEVRPAWACFENPAGILTMGFDDLLAEMEGLGYETEQIIIPACAVNAPHRRDRVWILAHSKHARRLRDEGPGSIGTRNGASAREVGAEQPQGSGRCTRRLENVANTDKGLYRSTHEEICARRDALDGRSWWGTEPDVGRVAHGISNGMDQLRTLGNAVVPQCAYSILKAIADTYQSLQER